PHGRILLARRDADVDRVRELRVRLVLVRLEGLLQPEDPELLELARDADRGLRIVPVAETGVDQDVGLACRLLRGRGERDVVLRILAERAPAELHGGEAVVAELRDALRRLLDRVRHQHRRVRAHAAVLRTAEQVVDGLALRLALDVPQRYVDARQRMEGDPTAADVDQPAVHLPPEALDVARILADQQVVERAGDRVGARPLDEGGNGLGGRVDLADADDALVGRDPDHEIVLAAVGDPVVHGRLAQDDGLDLGDLHACSLDSADGDCQLYVDCLQSPTGWPPRPSIARSTSPRPGSMWAGSSCRGRT